MKKTILLTLFWLSWLPLLAQTRSVTGRITDQSTGEALPGVSISVRGTQTGTVSAADGTYALSADAGATLIFSFIGYTAAEERIGARSTINVALVPGSNNLNEVVVVGYGTQRRANLTGAVAPIRREDLLIRQVATTSNLLQGLAPGITVTQQSGRPGADGARINVRGVGSIFANTTPLLIIDNVPQPPGDLNALNNLDANNIESISVLKDAASTAIYGARAANGVIVVRTKRGTEGVSVSYNGFISGQQATALPEKVSAIEHMELFNLARRNSGQNPAFDQALIDAYRQNPADNFRYFNTDWLGGIFTNSGLMHNHNLNVSAGTDRVKVFGAGTFLDQQGLTPNTSFRRYDLRLNTDVALSQKLSFQGDLIYTNATDVQPGAASAEFIIRQALGVPAVGAGKFGPEQYGDAGQSNFRNPIGQAESSGFNRVQRPNTVLRGSLQYRPFKFMDVEAMVSNNVRQTNQKRFIDNYAVFRPDLANNVLAFVQLVPGQNQIQDAITRERLNNYLLQTNFYTNAGRHDLRLTLGFQAEDYYRELLSASRTDLAAEQPFQSVGTGNINNSSRASDYALVSGFGRFNYAYDNRYLLELNGRYDGSSRFSQAQNRQWGFFPSVSAGWVISREAFMSGLNNVVTFAKLRGSIGSLGNQNLVNNDPDRTPAYYPFAANLNTLLLSGAPIAHYFNNRFTPGVAQIIAANPNITWETSTQANVGLDLTLLNKLTVTVDVYQRRISNMLLIRPIPDYAGVGAPFVNAGSMRNNGWEVAINYRNQLGQFRYDLTANLSDVRNRVLDLGGQDIIEGNFSTGAGFISRPGQPLRSYFGYVAQGLFGSADEVRTAPTHFANTAPGDIRYRDQNGDGKIDAQDRVVLGNSFPRYEYSFNMNLGWRGVDLNAFLQGVGRRDNYVSGTGAWAFFAPDFIASAFAIHRDNWRPDNPNASYPRLTDNITNNWATSSFWVRNAAYLRLKNVQLGYTLPTTLSQKARIRSVRLYVSGANLLTISNFLQGFDPEIDNQTGDFYPVMRTYTAGVNLRF